MKDLERWKKDLDEPEGLPPNGLALPGMEADSSRSVVPPLSSFLEVEEGWMTNWKPWASRTATIPRMTANAQCRRRSSALTTPLRVGGLTMKDFISVGSTKES
jgi:hypothetical protein